MGVKIVINELPTKQFETCSAWSFFFILINMNCHWKRNLMNKNVETCYLFALFKWCLSPKQIT